MPQVFRVLLIEDDPRRVERFRAWLPGDVVLAEARSVGQAMGFLTRLRPGELAGILLDHDLQMRAITSADMALSGSHLIDLIVRHVERDVAVLVHSTNPTGSASMALRLESAGFWVTRIAMYDLTQERLGEWIEDVRSLL